MNGEGNGNVLSQAPFRTLEQQKIVQCEKETMVGGIVGRHLGSKWGKLGRAQALLGAPREIPGGSPLNLFLLTQGSNVSLCRELGSCKKEKGYSCLKVGSASDLHAYTSTFVCPCTHLCTQAYALMPAHIDTHASSHTTVLGFVH